MVKVASHCGNLRLELNEEESDIVSVENLPPISDAVSTYNPSETIVARSSVDGRSLALDRLH
jgi:hypothetical protein